MVVTSEDLDEVMHDIKQSGMVAYDTEFIGEETYHPKICLVQLATRDFVSIIDPIAVEDLTPVWEMLADPSIQKLVHSGSVDLKHGYQATGMKAASVIDTQIASAFAGLPWPVGLARIIESYTGHRLGKGHTFTNWDARPLSRSQLRYAADDVRYLPMLWGMLEKDLKERCTYDWAISECNSRLTQPMDFEPDSQVRKASKGMQLKPRAQALLKALVIERDRIAEERNLPHRVIISDSALLEMVRRKPKDRTELSAIKGLPRPTVESSHGQILDLIARADELELPKLKLSGAKVETAADQVSVDALWMVICTRLLAQGIAPGIVVSRNALASWFLFARKDGKALLFAEDDWRHKALGEWLASFLDGKRKLEVAWGDGVAKVNEQPNIGD